jgi:putative ABC transport system permease protein
LSLLPAGSYPKGYAGPEKFTIIGVVEDAHYGSLQQPPRPLVYGLQSQAGEGAVGLQLVVRTTADPAQLIPAIRHELRQIDPDVPLANVTPLEKLLSNQLIQPRLELLMLGCLAVLAGVLAILGIYGVMAYTIAQRTREIGIQLALGATPGRILRSVLLSGAALSITGVALGLAASRALSSFLRSILFNVSATDFAVYISVASLLFGTALAAAYLPARRAARIDPQLALRYE